MNDPRFIAIKEAMKKRRRAAYQVEAKECTKATFAQQKTSLRTTRDAAMKELMMSRTKPG